MKPCKHSGPRKGGKKVKTGCGTCKIRKVKCDEGRPVCNRCSSTGRICDGYGIWGGGNTLHSQKQLLGCAKASNVIARPPAAIFLPASSTEEKDYFDWFKCRTSVKLPGSFVSSFWTTLLFQASQSEPAVLHAILALSSVHKRGIVEARSQGDVPIDQEEFALQHYVKAISYLQPHFSAKDKASSRVALITCVVFVNLEFLRGHFKTAQTHLENGLRILKEMHLREKGIDNSARLKSCSEPVDDWIIEAFSRLHLQLELFRYPYHHPCLLLWSAGFDQPDTVAIEFRSINEAWQSMERLLNKIFYLTHLSRRENPQSEACEPSERLVTQQKLTRAELLMWHDTYESSGKFFSGLKLADGQKVHHLLATYHPMASIMLETALHPNDELAFDSHTEHFVMLLKQCADLHTVSKRTSEIKILPGHLMDMSASVTDMGWIPQLYYAAIKCRVHRIRLQAVRLLHSTSHREGIWDSKTAARVARKVMEVEEGDFYRDVETFDSFSPVTLPRKRDLALPVLPDARRLREVEAVLCGAPMDTIKLFCKQRHEGFFRRILVSEYDVPLQIWTDSKDWEASEWIS